MSTGCHTPTAAHDAAPAPSAHPPALPADAGSVPPDLTTHASVTSGNDAAGVPVGRTREVDGAALRAKTRARLAGDRSPVVLLESHAAMPAFDLGERLCEAVVPRKPAATPIVLKPNLGGFEWFQDPKSSGGDDGVKGRTTDPEFVRGVIRCLRARGHTDVTIAEGWGAKHADWERLVRVDGYAKMAAEEHVPLVALDDDGVFDVMPGEPGKPLAITGMETTHVPTLLMPTLLADALEHGMFISLPKIKAHRYGVFSMSVKGMQGTVDLSDAAPAFHQKWRMHRELGPLLEKGKMNRRAYVASLETFAERIADVLEVEAPDVVLAEGAPAMGGDGFGRMWPSREKFAIGGTNPILVDRIGAEMLGLWNNKDLAKELGGHATSPLLEAAAKRFGVDITAPAVTGDGKGLLATPRPVHFVGMAGFAIHSDATPSLTSAEIGALGALAAAAPSSPPAEKPVVHATPLGAASITIDGRGDEPIWSRATPVTWDTDYAGSSTGTVTHARFVYAKDGLYVLFELAEAGLHTDRSRPLEAPRAKLYEEDCVELFLTPDAGRANHYFEIELGPFGHHLDIDVDRDRQASDASWSAGARIGATQDATARTAVIEVKLAAPEIVHALAAGARLPLGLYRMEGEHPRQYLAWSPPRTPRPSFHVPEAFGTLVLDP